MKAELPLAGVRVLAVEQYGAGPAGTVYLADLGAEVIKVENLREGGDVGRQVGPHFFGPGDSQFYQTFNRNKRSVSLDLKSEEGRAAFEKLVAVSDIVFSNLRGDQPGRLGLMYEQLCHLIGAIRLGSLDPNPDLGLAFGSTPRTMGPRGGRHHGEPLLQRHHRQQRGALS